jgi:hypothetical protein
MTIVIPLTVCKFCLASGNQEICHASSSSRTGGFASIDRPTLTFPGQVLMFDKRHRITLLFNANKAYDRQVVEGVGEYLQASQSEWDIFIEEDFRARIDNIKDWLGDGVIADYDDDDIAQLLADVDVPIIGVGVPTIGSKIIPRYITLLPTTTRW